MNANLYKAKNKKNDEFYTQMKDVQSEIQMYDSNFFKNKTIYCNTDTKSSSFVKYFQMNFDRLGLKLLINSSIDGSVGFYDGRCSWSKKINGDFRSDDCIELLKISDIIITNPPFSLFREFLYQLIEYKKYFLIIGNLNAVTYKEVFPLIKEGRVWLGHTSPKEFLQPNGQTKRFGNVFWFTNIQTNQKYDDIPLKCCYYTNEYKYPKFDNYGAINVDRVNQIPGDYYGVMGVPITFLTKHNPRQFHLLGLAAGNSRVNGFNYDVPYKKHKSDRGGCGVVEGKRKYARVFIQRVKQK